MRTRFAPSPTGWLHLGHAYAARVAWEEAHRAGGEFLLRLEDIDTTRCRPEYEAAILEDERKPKSQNQLCVMPFGGQRAAAHTGNFAHERNVHHHAPGCQK